MLWCISKWSTHSTLQVRNTFSPRIYHKSLVKLLVVYLMKLWELSKDLVFLGFLILKVVHTEPPAIH